MRGSLARGKKIEPRDHYDTEYMQQYYDVMLCETFGWTESQLLEENTQAFNDACTAILNEKAKYQNELHAKAEDERKKKELLAKQKQRRR